MMDPDCSGDSFPAIFWTAPKIAHISIYRPLDLCPRSFSYARTSTADVARRPGLISYDGPRLLGEKVFPAILWTPPKIAHYSIYRPLDLSSRWFRRSNLGGRRGSQTYVYCYGAPRLLEGRKADTSKNRLPFSWRARR